jgi:D-glycero-D-manno-heptose 1,7-bisphosphate phosphatase
MTKDVRRYVLLDRDGVINRHISHGYVTSWEQFEFLPGALDALRLLTENGYAALVISNQACVGKGLLSSCGLSAITRRFLLEVALAGGHIAQVYYCTHTEEDRCDCRKPQPGLLWRAKADYDFIPEETFFIGDSLSDIQAAAAAGCPAIHIQRLGFLDAPHDQDKTWTACNLREAAQMLVGPAHTAAKRLLRSHSAFNLPA